MNKTVYLIRFGLSTSSATRNMGLLKCDSRVEADVIAETLCPKLHSKYSDSYATVIEVNYE